MAFTLEQLEALETAIAQGARSVMYGNKQVMYNSTQEMLALRDTMRRELGLIPKTKRIFAKHSKGLE